MAVPKLNSIDQDKYSKEQKKECTFAPNINKV